MKKFLSLALALAMTAALLVGCGAKTDAPAKEETTPTTKEETQKPDDTQKAEEPVNVIEFSIATNATPGTVSDQAGEKLTQLLNDSGLFKVTYYNNSQLGSISDCFESILAGDYVMTLGGGSDWGDVVGEPNLGASMTPFLLDELDEIYGLTESDLWKGMIANAEKNVNVKIFNYPEISGSRYFLTPEPVVTPADMSGMLVRVPTSSYYVNAIKAFGGTPVSIPVGDLYTSLAQKMVDAAEFTYAATFTRQLYEVVGYMANNAYVTTFDFWGISTELWNALSDEQKTVLDDAVKQATELTFEVFPTLEAESKQKLIDAGMVFYDMDAQSFRDCMGTFYDLCEWTDEFKTELNAAMEAYRAAN